MGEYRQQRRITDKRHARGWAGRASQAVRKRSRLTRVTCQIWRCFLIWDYKKYIIVLPVLGYIASTGSDPISRSPAHS